MTQEEDISKWKHVISELCVKATDEQVKYCLRHYHPEKPSKEIVLDLKKCDKESLKLTYEFLGGKPENHKKDQLIDFIIQKIQNLFPDVCQICQKSYCINLEYEHFLSCGSCGQEIHKECLIMKLKNINLTINDVQKLFRIPGFHYLCPRCEQSSITLNEVSIVDQEDCKSISDEAEQVASPLKIQQYLCMPKSYGTSSRHYK